MKHLFFLLFCNALVATDPIAQQITIESQAKQSHVASLSLRLNIKRGEFLQLSDNSVWQIAPCCNAIAAKWLTAESVEIIPSDDPNYPYYIVNQATNERVMAHRISHLPQSG